MLKLFHYRLVLDHQSLRSRRISKWYNASRPPVGRRIPAAETSAGQFADDGLFSTSPFKTFVYNTSYHFFSLKKGKRKKKRTKVANFVRNLWKRSSMSSAAWYSSNRPLCSSPTTIVNSSTSSRECRKRSPTPFWPDLNRQALRISSKRTEWLWASSKTSANSKARSLGEDEAESSQDSRAKKGSKLPQMAVSKIYPDRLDTKAWDIKRKCRRSFLDFVSVGNKKFEVDRRVDIRKTDLMALSTVYVGFRVDSCEKMYVSYPEVVSIWK